MTTGAPGAVLDVPPGATVGALLLHRFPDGDPGVAGRIAAALVRTGIAVLRRELEEGRPADIRDLELAADALRSRGVAPALLIGHDDAGTLALAAAESVDGLAAVVTIGARSGEVRMPTRGALLVVHSPVDERVSIDHARRIVDAAPHPRSLLTADGADHLLTSPRDADFVAGVIASWAPRHLPPTASDPTSRPAPPRGVVDVRERDAGGLAQSIEAGSHVLAADEPEPVGRDTAPNPFDLMLAGLGACTSMTVRLYADRKGWPLDHVEVRASRTRRDDGERFDLVVTLEGDALTAEQRERLLEVADRCPVHRVLTGPLEIVTRAAD